MPPWPGTIASASPSRRTSVCRHGLAESHPPDRSAPATMGRAGRRARDETTRQEPEMREERTDHAARRGRRWRLRPSSSARPPRRACACAEETPGEIAAGVAEPRKHDRRRPRSRARTSPRSRRSTREQSHAGRRRRAGRNPCAQRAERRGLHVAETKEREEGPERAGSHDQRVTRTRGSPVPRTRQVAADVAPCHAPRP